MAKHYDIYPYYLNDMTQGQFIEYALNYLHKKYNLTPTGLKRLYRKDKKTALAITRDVHTIYRMKTDTGSYRFITPDVYDTCPDKEHYTPYLFKPPKLLNRRGEPYQFVKKVNAFQNNFDAGMMFGIILIELEDLKKLKRLSKDKKRDTLKDLTETAANGHMAYCKIERSKKSINKHHIHILILCPESEFIEGERMENGYLHKYVKIGHGKYSHLSELENMVNFLKYLHKSYDARIYAGGKNRDNLYRLLCEELAGIPPMLTCHKRWGINGV